MAFGEQGEGFQNPQNLAVQNLIITTGSIRGVSYEINKNGFFFYSGVAGSGNLIASIAPAAGTDRFGNAFLAGFTSYDPLSTNKIVNIVAGVVSFQSAALPTQTAGLIQFASASLAVISAKASGGTANELLLAGGASGATLCRVQGDDSAVSRFETCEPNNPGATTAWHSLSSFAAGWSVGGECQYKMSIDNEVKVWFRNLVHDGVTANPDGSVILSSANGLPSAFRPSSARRFAVYCNQIRVIAAGPPTTSSGPALEIETDGSIQCFGMAQACTRVDGYARLPLN